jgi:ergothioneine biosynthesis protein EgtB
MATQPAAPHALTDSSHESNGRRRSLVDRYETVRSFTETLCEPLATEDYVVQTMENVSPTKWHLAHTTWFWETFLLQPYDDDYEPINETYAYLFNSYYVQAGERHCRNKRGYISRPTVEQVYDYRAYVDEHMLKLLESVDGQAREEVVSRSRIGLHHEQQHQELMVTDIKHVFGSNPIRPVYSERDTAPTAEAPPVEWIGFDEGVRWIGHDGDGFSFDNERPRHRKFVHAFELASRPVTNGEYIEFIEDGGYAQPPLWLSAGWATVQEKEWSEPFYWEKIDGEWMITTLAGRHPVDPAEPVCHLSYYEADAYARWAGARLPTEEEWETAAERVPVDGNFVENGRYHPAPASHDGDQKLLQMFGDVWEWTQSSYEPYPGFEPLPGALGEYNGKFMCNQYVLRGGSCATSKSHIRRTYRNFFHTDECWQFTGLRLARDL